MMLPMEQLRESVEPPLPSTIGPPSPPRISSPRPSEQMAGAKMLRGDAVVQDIEHWCLKKGHKHGREPVLACVFFNTDQEAVDYVRIKAHVAKRAGVGYWVYEAPVDGTTSEVQSLIRQLNRNDKIHGILIQRPVPEHMNELKIMGTISPQKHIEEYSDGRSNNIAADAFTRLMDKYGLDGLAHRSGIHIAGFGNIITDGFITHMRRHYPRVEVSLGLEGTTEPAASAAAAPPPASGEGEGDEESTRGGTLLVSELHKGPGYITRDRLASGVRVIIDLGFFATEKGINGDVDHELFDRRDLAISPTPGGVLPILLWLMMERTIRSNRMMSHKEASWCLCQ